eukprot:GHVQ01029345.1.p1 GENE.GHVQ01029345.1~~GHVQ01029345.1.p1  ORF type:complete len:358 (+),score=26.37 GHVQ01029345.1:24-1076(+)
MDRAFKVEAFRVLGIKNSPAEFQRVMDNLLSDLYGQGVLCYIDDIVIYANAFEELVRLLEEVLKRLSDGGVFVEPKKCEFGSREMELLGHVLSPQGIMPNPKKVRAIREASPPSCRKTLMSFLGVVGFVRRFIPRYSEHTTALTQLLKKGVPFVWSEACHRQFEHLKDLVSEFVLLSAPKGTGPFVILCDASNQAIGSVLAQWQEDELVILEFAAKKFTTTEQKWSTHEREAFAIKWSVKHFEDYVKAARIFILTDHASLQWMHNSTVGKVQRWALYLQQFDIRVRAIPGQDNPIADWLSRPTNVPDSELDDEIDEVSVPILVGETESTRTPMRQHFALAPYLPTALLVQ